MTGRDRFYATKTPRAYVTPNHPFVTEAIKRGLDVEGFPRMNMMSSKRRVVVNGFICSLHYAIKRPIGSGAYWQIRRIVEPADFYVWAGPNGYLILPDDQQPMVATMITFTPRRRPGAYSKRHDYINHLNRWDYLEGKR